MNILETIKELVRQSDKVEFWEVDKQYLVFFFDWRAIDYDFEGYPIYGDVLFIYGSDEGFISRPNIKLKLERAKCPKLLLKIGGESLPFQGQNSDYVFEVLMGIRD